MPTLELAQPDYLEEGQNECTGIGTNIDCTGIGTVSSFLLWEDWVTVAFFSKDATDTFSCTELVSGMGLLCDGLVSKGT